MAFNLKEINLRASADPGAFAAECEADYTKRLADAAGKICGHMAASPIVLISGPSGSGKTTTAKKLCDELFRRGVTAHTVSFDNYYLPLAPEDAPRAEDGSIDYESPLCLDLPLLNEHFSVLSRGEEITVPHFSFQLKARRKDKEKPLRLQKDEVAVFEGIHAFNDIITDAHPEAFKFYISARSDIHDNGAVCFKGTWIRLMRRTVRDNSFRATDAQETLGMWANVRRGEKKYISPNKNKANILFDSSMPYEVPVLKEYALSVFDKVPDGAERFEELKQILPSLQKFADVDSEFVPPDSILREFIGGGNYKY